MNLAQRLLPILCFLLVLPLSADSYISFHIGRTISHSDMDLDLIHIGHPTYCDSLLYPNPAEAPTGGACAVYEKQRAYAGKINPDAGWFARYAVGRRFDVWRLEVIHEHSQLNHVEQLLPLATTGDSQISSKSNEWSQFALPSNTYDDQGTRILAFNGLRDFALSDKWTGYVGVGLGIAHLDFNYGNDFLRKTVAEGYLEVPFPVDWPEIAKTNAAGTLSAFYESVTGLVTTYSFIAGVDFDTGQDTSLGVRLTWREFGEFTHKDAVWTTIRSHAPVLADGRTPFISDLEFKPWGYLGFSFVLTRYF